MMNVRQRWSIVCCTLWLHLFPSQLSI